MQRRDTDDSTRSLAPLKPAADAIVIDSTNLSIQEVVDLMLSHISEKR
jgi:cytidylate kinase